jgi:hypothetical protein
VVVNLSLKFDNPGIQMQVNNEVKSEAETKRSDSHDCEMSVRGHSFPHIACQHLQEVTSER